MTAQDLQAPEAERILHFFPDYSSGNPFQTMLHSRLGLVGARPVAVSNLVQHLRRSAEEPGDPGVLSLHWTVPILQRASGPFRAKLLLDRFTAALDGFLGAGGRLIWTVHNVLPHDAVHRWAEIDLARLLADRADLVHVLSEATFEAVGDLYHLDPAKVVVIEHSSYLGYYPDQVTREEARQRLGLEHDHQVLLALGGIRPYKGLDLLLDVFERLAEPDPTLRLLVAGRAIDGQAVEQLRERCASTDRVIAHFEHVADDELQVWMRAADLAVLPYRAVLNSGAFLLAQTFGLPVVAPRVGALRSWEDEPQVTLFDPADSRSLAEAITQALGALQQDPSGLRAQSRAAAEARQPATMAAAYARAVAPLLPVSGQ